MLGPHGSKAPSLCGCGGAEGRCQWAWRGWGVVGLGDPRGFSDLNDSVMDTLRITGGSGGALFSWCIS